MTKEESSLPTVSLYSLYGFVSNGWNGRKESHNIDISGAFLQGNWPQDEHPGYIMFKGIMVDMICEINPSYHDKIIWSKDRKRRFYYG